LASARYTTPAMLVLWFLPLWPTHETRLFQYAVNSADQRFFQQPAKVIETDG